MAWHTAFEAGQVPAAATDALAGAGSVGEPLVYTLGSGSAITLTTATAATVVSGPFTAGEWYIWCDIHFVTGLTTNTYAQQCGVSQTTNVLQADEKTMTRRYGTSGAGIVFGSTESNMILVPVRHNFLTTTTVHAVARSDFTSTAPTAYGKLFGARLAR